MILTLALFPCLALWVNAGKLRNHDQPAALTASHIENVLLAMHIDPIVARLSGHYMKTCCWLLPAMFLYNLMTKYLQVQV